MPNINLRVSWAVCITAFASGCAVNPVVTWTPPPNDATRTATNLDYASAYARNVQEAYKKEIARQAGVSSDLSSGLVAMGALALALAAGKAHRDAVAGVALLGGTGYALGNMNLNKQRLLILQAGHEAIGCARNAVIPLRMSDKERGAIEDALIALDTAGPALDVAEVRSRAALAAYKKAGGLATSDAAVRASAALEAAAAVSTAVAGASGSGRVLVTQSRQAGERLIAAVDKIDAAVVRASIDNQPDLTSVPKVIAGLAGFAAQIAPGAGVDKVIAAGLAAGTEKLKSGPLRLVNALPADEPLNDASQALENAMAALQTQLRIVQSYLLAYQPGTAALEALKDCGVTDVYFPLKASVEKLVFATGTDATKGFVLSGGAKPYVVELADSPITGLSIKGPAPFETRVQVTLTKDVTKPQSASVLVMDSSNPMKTLHLPITIGEQPAAPSAAAGAAAGAAPKVAALPDVVDALNDGFSFTLDKIQVTPGQKAQATGDAITVGVTCTPKPAAPFEQATIRDKLLDTVAPDKKFVPLAAKVKVLPSSNCVKEK